MTSFDFFSMAANNSSALTPALTGSKPKQQTERDEVGERRGREARERGEGERKERGQ